jgi:hypothetical protein
MVSQNKRGLCVTVKVEDGVKRRRRTPARFRTTDPLQAPVPAPAAPIPPLMPAPPALDSPPLPPLHAVLATNYKAICALAGVVAELTRRQDAMDKEIDDRADFEAARRHEINMDVDLKIDHLTEQLDLKIEDLVDQVADQMSGLKSALEKKFRLAIKTEANTQDAIVDDVEKQIMYQMSAVERGAADDLALMRTAIEGGAADDLALMRTEIGEMVDSKLAAATSIRIPVLEKELRLAVKVERDYQDAVSDDVERRARATEKEVRAQRNAIDNIEEMVDQKMNNLRSALVGDLQEALDIVSERVD